MARLTVLIPCKDEQLNIRECIESARLVADEILVADSGSTDDTLSLVRTAGGCRIIKREYVNSANFKNWAIPQASHPWVLVLDADERVTPELAEEIRGLLASDPTLDGFRLRRQNYFLGHPIHYCGWNTTTLVRLFRREAGRYAERRVHADVELADERVGDLAGKLLHYTAWDFTDFVGKQNRYSSWAAEDLHEQGRSASLWGLLGHAPLRFLQLYLLRGGVFDGTAGLIVCLVTAWYTFLKEAKLWSLQHTLNHPGRPPLSRRRWGTEPGDGTETQPTRRHAA
jgi:(heptosyl)LPS beta-1,4-glucosyltransferase